MLTRSTQATEPNVLRVTFLNSSRWPWNWVTLLWLHQPTWPRPSIDRLVCPLSWGCLLWSIQDALLWRLHRPFPGKAEFVYLVPLGHSGARSMREQSFPAGQATHLPCIFAFCGQVSQGPWQAQGWVVSWDWESPESNLKTHHARQWAAENVSFLSSTDQGALMKKGFS